MDFAFMLARRKLLSKKGVFSSFIIRLAILSTAVSVFVMLLAIGIVNGFKQEIKHKIFNFWGNIIVTDYSVNPSNLIHPEPIIYTEDLVSKLENTPGVETVQLFSLKPAILKSPTAMEGIKLKGIPEPKVIPGFLNHLQAPLFPADQDRNHIYLSRTILDKIQLKVGDALQLYFIEPNSFSPRIRKAVIAGTFHTGMEEVDKQYAVCDIRFLQKLNNWEANQVNGYQLNLTPGTSMHLIADQIHHDILNPPLYAYTMEEIFQNIYDWLQLQDLNALIVLGIMGIVALINLSVTLIILIVQQVQRIGLLKALGMTNGQLVRFGLYQALIIAGIGMIIGNSLALGFSYMQNRYGWIKLDESTYYMSSVPVRINYTTVLWIDLVVMAICIITMLIPALLMKSVQPAKAIQFK